MKIPAVAKSTAALQAAIVLALAALGFSWELIQANGGLGWDGVFYVNPPQMSPYYLSRSVPIWVASQIPAGSTVAWRLLNFFCSIGSLILWLMISNLLQLKGGRWLGFCGLFLTFQAKQFYFDPVLVDATAAFMSMLLLYLHLRGAVRPLFVATIISSFCWPTAGLTGAALLAFSDSGRPEHPVRAIPLLVVVTALSMVAYAVCWWLRSPLRSFATAIPSYALLAIAAWPLIDRYRIRSPLVAIVALVPVTVAAALAKGTAGGSAGEIFGYMVQPQSGMFFLPVVSLAVYFGPVFVLACLNWSKVAVSAKHLRVTLPILINLPFALTTEPRHFLFGWPFLVVCVAQALDAFSWEIALLAVLWSQFWLPINIARWTAGTTDVTQFPKQLWFMHFGFWMSFPIFVFQGGAILITAYLLHRSALLRQCARVDVGDAPARSSANDANSRPGRRY